jgi:diguanylate cyclase (GGDEF)-like protein
MVGFGFLLYIDFFTFEQLVPMMTTPLMSIFIVGSLLLAVVYFHRFARPLKLYLSALENHRSLPVIKALKSFPLHYWLMFLVYIVLAPAATILSLEMSTDYIAQPVDWFRIHLVALIVSIIVGLPIFISIYDLLGKAFGQIRLQHPIIAIKTKVFLIGALIPLLIDTMLVQYYWTRTGFFSSETFVIWLLLECLAIAGALLFVRSFSQSLAPLNSLIDAPLNALGSKILPASTDELGIFANQLGKLLDEQQLNQQRLAFSNDLLKSVHSHENLARLLQTVVDRTCQTLQGDMCFLSLYDPHKNKLVCMVYTGAEYNPDGYFQIGLDDASIHAEVFRSAKAQTINNALTDSRSHQQIKAAYNVRSCAAVPLFNGEQVIGVLQIASIQQSHHYSIHEVKLLEAFAQEAALIQIFFDDLKHRRKTETAITQIMLGVSTTTGANFFKAIIVHMARILQADSCGIATTVPGSEDTMESLAFFKDGKITTNIKYPLKGTPCETVIGQMERTYPSDLQNTFPDDRLICDTGMESYVGIPLFDSHNMPQGLLFAMFRDPIKEIEFNESVMRIFAARTAAEIERNQTEERIRHMAYYDGLTQLPNREYLLDRLQQAIAHAYRHQTRLVVMMLDLDNFKKINDSLGHPVGDGLLIEVAQRLQQCIRQEDTVARMGGDEFIILQSDFDSRESAIQHVSRVVRQLFDTLKVQYSITEHALIMSCSCGIAIYPDDGDTAELLIKHADTAMYQAKANGRDDCQFFSSEMNTAVVERLEMESAIYKAIENQDFELVYQPKVSVADNRIIGAEALLRWHHPEQGDIPPDRFIPVADETGQIIQLGEYVLQQACELTSDLWCNTNCCDEFESLSINVSPRQFQQPDFITKIQQILESNQTHASCIELEITENILIDGASKVSEKLQILKDMGVNIAIDDFGTGYASLRYLQRLPINMIKIDRSFIAHITDNANDLTIVKTIITMAQNLNIRVIAEGVETAEQLQLLNQLGCLFYQGYFFSKPVSKDDFVAMVRQQRKLSA